MDSTTPSTADQEANAELRERYLRFIGKMSGQEVEMRLFEKITLTGRFSALQRSQEHYLIDDLVTPTGTLQHAMIRMGDTVSISTKLDIPKCE